ncbi:MAG: FAD-dependent oxidoreductase [Pseudomonadota bacterium]
MSHPFVISDTTPATHLGPLPEAVDVVVIGGGVIGVSTALYLARAGQSVVLLEKGRIAGEQSSRNWGWIRQQGRDHAELPIMTEAIGRWQELAQETNVDIGLRQKGVIYLASSEAERNAMEKWASFAEGQGLDTRMLSGAEARDQFDGINRIYFGGMITPSDMRAEPWRAVPALAGIAVRAGARIVEHCAVRALDIAAGRVTGVLTEQGPVACERVVLAGGAWSSLFLRNHGVEIPQLSVRESVLATGPLPEVSAGAAADDWVAWRRRADGGYTLAPSGASELYIGPDAFRSFRKYMPQLRSDPLGQTYRLAAPRGFPDAWSTPRRWSADRVSPLERVRVLNPRPNARALRRTARKFAGLFPGLPDIQIKTTWAGMIDTMPDVVPIVDTCAQIPGLVIGTGMSGHGFGIGPAMGRILAALAMEKPAGHDLKRFRANRFSDGSPIKLGPLA